jgi:hypothetical protein
MILTLLGEMGIYLFFLRLAIGRWDFPCALYLMSFCLVIPFVAFPILWRCWVYFSICKISAAKVLVDSGSGNSLRIFTFFISNWCLVAVLLLFYIIHAIFYFCILFAALPYNVISSGKGCSVDLTINLLFLAQSMLYIIPIAILTILMIVSKNVKDRLGIKIELLITMCIWTVTLIIFVAWTIASSANSVLSNMERYFPAGFVLAVGVLLHDLVSVWLPIILTFGKKHAVNVGNDNQCDEDLLIILRNDQLRSLFKQHLVECFAPELILFWEDLQLKFYTLKGDEMLLSFASEIMQKYFSPDSVLELNIPSSEATSERLQITIETFQQGCIVVTTDSPVVHKSDPFSSKSGSVIQNTVHSDLYRIFDHVREEIETDMKDHLVRFMHHNKKSRDRIRTIKLEQQIGVL